jgi:hypothetical protein
MPSIGVLHSLRLLQFMPSARDKAGSIRADINKSVFMDPSFVLGIISLLTERESGVRQTPEGRFIAEYWRDTRKMADINLLN